ncbi:MAG: NAD-dependent epimerase/dehydratase family protein [Bacteroidetes bacterium]|nr:NAD-dependent epimerase/dehydratase family protein [Bacteroidota bacterium]
MPGRASILVIGASGQIGTELILELRKQFGSARIIASDIKVPGYEVLEGGPFEILDVLDKVRLDEIVRNFNIKEVYMLAALLSATAEQNQAYAWKLNVEGLFNVLHLAREKRISKIFWPSSIAVFGPDTPKDKTPQKCIMNPATIYGISKLTGERWCEYYFMKYRVDSRSIRYPGLVGYKSAPGGGTTDYAVQIFYEAIRKKKYICYLKKDTVLPMMYMPDAIRGTIELMNAKFEKIKIRSSYNFSGMSFSPDTLAAEIKKHLPAFECLYSPDHRQQYADSWPRSINDTSARKEWGWKAEYNIKTMTSDMLENLMN